MEKIGGEFAVRVMISCRQHGGQRQSSSGGSGIKKARVKLKGSGMTTISNILKEKKSQTL